MTFSSILSKLVVTLNPWLLVFSGKDAATIFYMDKKLVVNGQMHRGGKKQKVDGIEQLQGELIGYNT